MGRTGGETDTVALPSTVHQGVTTPAATLRHGTPAFPAAGRCMLEVDPHAWVLLGALPFTDVRLAQSRPLPDDPALHGLQATVQAVIAPTNGPLDVDFSNGCT